MQADFLTRCQITTGVATAFRFMYPSNPADRKSLLMQLLFIMNHSSCLCLPHVTFPDFSDYTRINSFKMSPLIKGLSDHDVRTTSYFNKCLHCGKRC